MPGQNLLSLLWHAAEGPSRTGVISYCSESPSSSFFLSYKSLLELAKQRSMQLQNLKSPDNYIILMHLADHLDSIKWFWAIVAAGCIPCICPPLAKDLDQRRKDIAHLQGLLGDTLVITTRSQIPEFLGMKGLRIVAIGKCPRSNTNLVFPEA
jgi:hypothetical protein